VTQPEEFFMLRQGNFVVFAAGIWAGCAAMTDTVFATLEFVSADAIGAAISTTDAIIPATTTTLNAEFKIPIPFAGVRLLARRRVAMGRILR
jgi:hydrogenase/urease accessory protein HupE